MGLAMLIVAAAGGGSAASGAPEKSLRLQVYEPTADTHVTAERPRTNFGRSPHLRVNRAPEANAYVRFRLRKRAGEIVSVTLLLHSRSSARASFAVRRATGRRWDERRLTYATAPRCSLRYASARVERHGMWTAIDVTSFVDAGDREVSLAITTRGSRELSFGSRESREAPRLVVRVVQDDGTENHVLDSLRRMYPD